MSRSSQISRIASTSPILSVPVRRKFLRTLVLLALALTMVAPSGSVLASDEIAAADSPTGSVACPPTGNETVSTDKADYAPGEVVLITGTGYAAACDVVVQVTRPDGSIVLGDGSFAPGSDTVTTGSDGSLAYNYQLNGIEGLYLVDVLGEADVVLASVTFTDALPLNVVLYADSGRTIVKNAFERGDTVYARGTATGAEATQLRYQYNLSTASPFGASYPGYPTGCLTPTSGNIDDQHTLLQTDTLSNITRWTYRLTARGPACTGGSTNRDQTFFVYQAYAYTTAAARNACLSDATCGSPTPRPIVAPGDPVYLQIRGFAALDTNSAIRFRRPDGSIACTVAPVSSDALGAVSFDYPSGTCPAIGNTASDIGSWTVDATANWGGVGNDPVGSGFVAAFTTNLDAFTVKAPLLVATAVHDASDNDITNGSTALGSIVHDTATLGGTVSGHAAPPVTFTFFANGTCDGTGTAVAANGSEGAAARSADVGPLAAGTYSFNASVAENASYFGDSSDCEPFTVDTATPTVVTEVHRETTADSHVVLPNPGGVPYGTTIHDKAIVTGVTGIAPTGTVTYTLFKGLQNCAGVIAAGPETVAVGVESTSLSNLAPGRYSYLATYSGDLNYPGPASAACEIVEVGKATPGIRTEVHVDGNHTADVQNTAVPLGTSVHDKAIITPVDNLAVSGTVTYTFFNGTTNEFASICDGVRTSETVAVGSESSSTGPLGAGSYAYRAIYNGNDNYQSNVRAACEPFTVSKATPRVETVVHRETTTNSHTPVANPGVVPFGSTVHDKAFLFGQVGTFPITGTVTFTLFKGTQNCAGDIFAGPQTVAVSASTESSSVGPMPAGRYSYSAVYNGDANYESVTAACEIFEVPKGTTSVTTELHEGSRSSSTSHVVIPIGGYTFATTVHDKATVGGAVTGIAMTGQVRYTFFNGNTNPYASICDGPRTTELKNLGEESSDGTNLAPGQYAFRAEYLGDINYAGSLSPCEPFTIVPTTRVFGKTMGFWGNKNGIARIQASGGYAANAVSIGRGAVVDTKAESLKILPITMTACGKGAPFIFTVGAQTNTQNCTLATGINMSSLDILASQTLALGYNIKLPGGYGGQTIGSLGCTPVGSLTTSSRVNDAFAAAVALIDGSASGGTTTQAQIGAFNTLLGCLNRES